MISSSQIKAARAMLGWSALDLAEKKSSERNSASGIVVESGTLTILAEGSDIDCSPSQHCQIGVVACEVPIGLFQFKHFQIRFPSLKFDVLDKDPS